MTEPRRKEHILVVNTQDSGGGAAAVAHGLWRAYRQNGHPSTFAVGRRSIHDPAVVPIPNHASKPLSTRILLNAAHRLKKANGHGLPAGFRAARALEWLAEPDRQTDLASGVEDFHYPATADLLDLPLSPPDLLHLHNLHGGYFDLRALPHLSQQLPTFITLHDSWLLSGHCAHPLDCDRWQTGCGNCPDLALYPAVAADATDSNWQRKRDIFKQSRLHLATPCRWLMDKVERSMLAPGIVDAKVIPYGVDLAVFTPGNKAAARAALDLPQNASVLLFAAAGIRNNPWKDYQTLRDAVAIVGKQKLDRPLIFLAVGEQGPPQEIGAATILFVPYLPEETAVARYYQAADLYLHAAKADTFPNSVIEAMACGAPVIATAVGGIPEQVEQGVTGLLTPPGDSKAMAAAITNLLTDHTARRSMAAAALRSAQHRFDQRRHADDYLNWFQRVRESRAPFRIAA